MSTHYKSYPFTTMITLLLAFSLWTHCGDSNPDRINLNNPESKEDIKKAIQRLVNKMTDEEIYNHPMADDQVKMAKNKKEELVKAVLNMARSLSYTTEKEGEEIVTRKREKGSKMGVDMTRLNSLLGYMQRYAKCLRKERANNQS